MKDWINENKFMAGIIGAFGLVAILLASGCFIAYSKKGELKKEIGEMHTKIAGLRSKYGAASSVSKGKLKAVSMEQDVEGLALYEKVSEVAYSDIDLTKSETDFSELLVKYVKELKKVMKAADVSHADSSMFGFEEYSTHAIVSNKKAIGLAIYEMDAFSSLLKSVAKVGPEALNSFDRELLAEELEDSSTKPKRSKVGAANAAKTRKVEVFRRMPFRMSLTLEEFQLGELLALISNNKKHLFVVKTMRLQNTKVSPIKMPSIMSGEENDTGVDKEAALFDFPSDGLDEEADSEGETKSFDKGEQILEQVYGKEKIKLVLEMELLLLNSKSIPVKLNSVKQ